MLPTYEEINKWDDEKLKHVHHLLFDKNINPSMGESQEDVDDYLYMVHLQYENRNLIQ